MTQYVVDFEWEGAPPDEERPRRLLLADTDDAAKLEAALLFAVGDFRSVPPVAYRILDTARGEVFRFPET